MKELKKGDVIVLTGGLCANVAEKLGDGGQGAVYRVTVDGKPHALKWYTCKFKDKTEFRKNLEKNISDGPPDGKFIWPLFLTDEQNDGFGYIMALRPKEFLDFSDILNNKVKFTSTFAEVTAGLNIVNAFRALHRKGLSYQDLNDGNFFINVNNGDVLICDNDNVTPDGQKNSGDIAGKPGYMAPEIVRGESSPHSLTDCHSLSVILFKLFCRHDPLMGESYVQSVCITEERERELYGEHPVFIFDPNDETNRPVRGVHPNPLKLWPILPKFLREAFESSFAKGMKDPNARLPENEWQKILVKFRDRLLTCPSCNNELPLPEDTAGKVECRHCRHSYSYPPRLEIGKYQVPLFPRTKLFACHTSAGNDDYSTVAGEVIMNRNNPSLWGIKNLSDDVWYMETPGGEIKDIGNGSVIPIAVGLKIRFRDVRGTISGGSFS
jgi:serine/threonine protein kinase